ncbi:MAG: glycosyltransferase family 4 protein [Elainellaceae cyanobacterium]
MNICIVTHRLLKGDGQGRVNYEVAMEALRQGHSLTLVASDVAAELLQHPQVMWIALPVKGIPTELLRNIAFSIRSARWLRQYAAKCDLVLANGAITSFSADVNVVHFVHSDWLRSPANRPVGLRGLYQRLYTALNAHWEKQAFRRSTLLIAVSQQVKQSLMSIGVPEEKIRVILNGVDTVEFSPGTVSRDLWNLPAEVPLGLFAGDIKTPRKNLDTVLHALTQVSTLHLAVAGDTQGSPYPKLAEELGVGDRVHFLGYRRDVKDLMKAVDFFIFPSRYEACSLVLLEAMASGLPVITAATAGGAEIITPDCGVVLPDPDNASALAQVLQSILQSPEARSRMGSAARRRAEQQTWSAMGQQYLGLFETFASSTPNHETHRRYSHLLSH